MLLLCRQVILSNFASQPEGDRKKMYFLKVQIEILKVSGLQKPQF